MAKETKPVTNESKVGQMYEERKKDGTTGRIGVIEEYNDKFKTFMMRDIEGNSFNITVATLKSNWRKYQGDLVIQTSAQVEEQKAEEKKAVEKAENVVQTKTAASRISTEEKVKRLRALNTVVENMIKSKQSNLRVSRKSKGAIVVSYKKSALFEIWEKYNIDKLDFAVKEDLVAFDRDGFDHVIKMTEYEYLEKWIMKHRCRVSVEGFSKALSALLDIAIKYEQKRDAETTEKKSKKSNEKNEEEEKN